VLNFARALCFKADLPIKFWKDYVLAVVDLINRAPIQVLHGKTPYETLFGAKPFLDHIKVFGCLCFPYNSQRKRNKFGEEVGVYLLGILMAKRVRRSMIWKLGILCY